MPPRLPHRAFAAHRHRLHLGVHDERIEGYLGARGRAPASRDVYRAIIARLVEDGAEATILGCTEIMPLVQPEDSPVPIFDTTVLHAAAAIEMALAG